jgi:hypothetical protein
MMQVPFLDLKQINLKDYTEISQAIDEVINGGWLLKCLESPIIN